MAILFKADVVILKNRKEIKGIITRILDYKTGDNKKTYVIEIMAVAGINQTYTTGAFSFTDIVSLEYKKMVLVSEQIKSYKISTTYYSRINGGENTAQKVLQHLERICLRGSKCLKTILLFFQN